MAASAHVCVFMRPFPVLAEISSVVSAERFPWCYRTSIEQLQRLQYVTPIQLTHDDISNGARRAVQSLLAKVVLSSRTGHSRQRSLGAFPSVPPVDPDSLLCAYGFHPDRVRMSVLSVMVSLFRSYRMYIRPQGLATRASVTRPLPPVTDLDEVLVGSSSLPIAPGLQREPSLSSLISQHASASTNSGRHSQLRKRQPLYNDIFLKEEFLAEQTHDESRELLRYCVTMFMPFSNFIIERCEVAAARTDLFDRWVWHVLRW